MSLPPTQEADNARVLVFSTRHLSAHVSRCWLHEFEDVICGVDHVCMLAPAFPEGRFTTSGPFAARVSNLVARKAGLGKWLKPLGSHQRIQKDFDLFFAFIRPWEILFLNSLPDWRERCRRAVVWIDELWPNEIPRVARLLSLLKPFDLVLLNYNSSVQPVADQLGIPVAYLPPGIDALRFCPHPPRPPRGIDVYALGRRPPLVHQALLALAEQRRLHYVYDTVKNFSVMDHREHRILIAQLAQRSRYFLANQPKFNDVSPYQGQAEVRQEELTPRFFEGAAAGTVMLGLAPQGELFQRNFGWPDAVIRLPLDGQNVAAMLADLDAQPERLVRIRRDNMIHSLRHHDWAYRWESILRQVRMDPLPGLDARKRQLNELAAGITKNLPTSG